MVKEIKSATNNTVVFSKNLAHLIVASSLVTIGVYAALQGRKEQTAAFAAVLLLAGAINVLIGFGNLYRALMQKG